MTNQFKRQHFIEWCEDNKEDLAKMVKQTYPSDFADKLIKNKNGYGLLYEALREDVKFKLFPNKLLNPHMRFQFNEKGSSILFDPKLLFSQKANRSLL